jgi:hypothetical protein
MIDNFDKILDQCIDRINNGESIESCLADYPGHSKKLRPLLMAVLQSKRAYTFVPREETKLAAKRSFNAAMDRRLHLKKDARPWLSRIFSRRLTWAALAAITAAIVGIYFGLNQMIYPISPFVPEPNPEGNFIFLISDDVNAISDFESVDVSITKMGLFSSDNGGWIEIDPDIEPVDLTTVQGDETLQIWRGDLPEGKYTKVFIYVSNAQGVLKDTIEADEQSIEIKLPSNKLHMFLPFQITEGTVTSFTYDLTVIATGNEKSGIRYILKPQADESGVDSIPAKD